MTLRPRARQVSATLMLLVVPAAALAAEGRLPYTLEPIFSHTWNAGVEPVVGDFDGDGLDEVASVHDDTGEIIFLRFVGDSVATVGRFDADVRGERWSRWGTRGAVDLDGDGSEELIIEYVERDTLRLMGYGLDAGVVVDVPLATGDDVGHEPYWDGMVHSVAALSLSPGERAILVCVAAQADGLPRELVLLSEGLEDVLWRYPGGAMMRRLCPVDIDGDGSDEIAFATAAPGNVPHAEHLPDDSSYVGVLDTDGRELWVRRTGGWGTDAYVVAADLDGDGVRELVCLTTPEQDAIPQESKITVWEAATGEALAEFRVPERAAIPFVMPGPGARDQVALATRPGAFRVFGWKNGAPAVVAANDTGNPVRLDAVADIPGIPEPALVCVTDRGRVRLFSEDLKMLAEYVPPRPTEMWAARAVGPYARSDGAEPFLAVSDNIILLAATPAGVPWKSVARLGVAAAVLALGGALAVSSPFRRRVSRASAIILSPVMPWAAAERERARFELLVALETGGHDRTIVVRPLRRLVTILTMYEGGDGSRDLSGDLSAVASRWLGSYQETSRPSLVRIAELADGWGGVPEQARLLRETTGELDAALSSTVSAIDEGKSDQMVVQDLRARVEALEGLLQAMRARAGEAYITEADSVLRDALELCRGDLAEVGVELSEDVIGLEGVRVWLAPGDFQFLVSNLVTNAVRAMEGSAVRRLSVRASRESGFVVMEFEDTGRGVPDAEWENIFEYGRTSKEEGGGTGLYRSREAAAPLGGTIGVARSSPGNGTVIAVRLRVAAAAAPLPDA